MIVGSEGIFTARVVDSGYKTSCGVSPDGNCFYASTNTFAGSRFDAECEFTVGQVPEGKTLVGNGDNSSISVTNMSSIELHDIIKWKGSGTDNDYSACFESQCTETDGGKNTEACICGTAFCDYDNGLYCSSTLNKCSKKQMCANINGFIENTNTDNCLCGDTQCVKDYIGLYCNAATSTCSLHPPECQHTNGITLNYLNNVIRDRCLCGTHNPYSRDNFCKHNQYCHAHTKKCFDKSSQPCSNTDGTASNTEVCRCGGQFCPKDEFCYALRTRLVCPGPIPQCSTVSARASQFKEKSL